MIDFIEHEDEQGFFYKSNFVKCEVGEESIGFYDTPLDLVFLNDHGMDILSKKKIIFYHEYALDNPRISCSFYFTTIELGANTVNFNLSFNPNIFKWIDDYSLFSYMRDFIKISNDNKYMGLFWQGLSDFNSSSFQNKFINQKNKIVEMILGMPTIDICGDFKKIIFEIESYLVKIDSLVVSKSSSGLIEEFDFPDSIKVECQQYLIYFAKFLAELDIQASCEVIYNEAGKTLFSIVPAEKNQALSQIREALGIYLNLPRNNSISPMNPTFDLASQQLAANIYHLKSQLLLANAIIQQKELTIENQARLINQQSIANDILVKSLQKHNEEEDTENLVGEIVKVKKAEWEFIRPLS